MVEKSPTFQFWDSVLRMEIIGHGIKGKHFISRFIE